MLHRCEALALVDLVSFQVGDKARYRPVFGIAGGLG